MATVHRPGAARGRSERRRTVTATAAAKNFGRLVDEVRETQLDYVVERDGRPVVRISPASVETCSLRDLVDWMRTWPAPGPEFAREVAAARVAGNRPSVPRSAWDS